MKHYSLAEGSLWGLKMTIIRTLPLLLVASIVLSQFFSDKELAKNAYLIFLFVFAIFVALAIVEVAVSEVIARTSSSHLQSSTAKS